MLIKKHRLTKYKDFEKIWVNGRNFFIKEIGVKFSSNNLDCTRFGIVVPNKVIKKAVLRNKVKRKIREIIRKQIPFIKKGFDCIILARQGIGELSFDELKEKIDFILRKLGLLSSE